MQVGTFGEAVLEPSHMEKTQLWFWLGSWVPLWVWLIHKSGHRVHGLVHMPMCLLKHLGKINMVCYHSFLHSPRIFKTTPSTMKLRNNLSSYFAKELCLNLERSMKWCNMEAGGCFSECAGYGRGAGRQGRGGARGDPGAAGTVCPTLGAAQRADQGAVSGRWRPSSPPVWQVLNWCWGDTQVFA